MTIQEAYIKGLDDAEKTAIEKLTNALSGNNDGPFNNPQMEIIRQKILNMDNSQSYVRNILMGEPYGTENLTPIDMRIIEILEYVKSLNKPRPSSKVTVKIKDLFTKLEVDIIKNNAKLD